MRRVLAWPWMAALLFLMVVPGARADDKYLLRTAYVKGDVVNTETFESLTFDVEATANGMPSPGFTFLESERENRVSTMLDVDARGIPSAMRTVVKSGRAVVTLPNGQRRNVALSLPGKTFTLRRTGDKVALTVAGGTIPAETRQMLGKELDTYAVSFFPSREVSPGDEWDFDAPEFTKAIVGADAATLSAKFVEVTNYGGHPCAHIKVHIQGTFNEKRTLTHSEFDADGDLYHAIDLQRPLLLQLKGPMQVSGSRMRAGTQIYVTGTGEYQLRIAYTYAKLGSAPAAKTP